MVTHHAPTRRVGRWRRLALTLTAPLLAGGCSAPADPILIGSAPAAATGQIDLALPLHNSGFFQFDRWPNACDLLTDEDLRAVLPQAEGIRRRTEEQKLSIHPNLLSNYGPGVPFPLPFEANVKDAICKVALSLPGLELDKKYPDSTGYQITVEIKAAGTPEVVQENRPGYRDDPEVSLAGADCRLDSRRFGCTKGQVAFTLSTGSLFQEARPPDQKTRFQVGAEVTTFEWKSGDIARSQEQFKFEADHIGAELVKAIASKI